MRVKNCGEWIEVKSLEEASRIIRETIKKNSTGGTRWYGFKGNGRVFEGERQIAKVFYNGKIWIPDAVK